MGQRPPKGLGTKHWRLRLHVMPHENLDFFHTDPSGLKSLKDFCWHVNPGCNLEAWGTKQTAVNAACAHAAVKSANMTNNTAQMCDNSSLFICTSKNPGFPDFLFRLNRKSGFFFTITCPYTSGLI